MSEQPILFSGEMVQAILDGRKTVTRRVMKPQPAPEFLARGVVGVEPQWPNQDGVRWFMADGMSELVRCPYGQPGDLLVPLTTWAVHRRYDHLKPLELPRKPVLWSYWESDWKPARFGRLRPGRFLPKRLRHLLPRLENTDVSAERLQDISDADVIAEGIKGDIYGEELGIAPKAEERSAHIYFMELWDLLNAKRGFGWEANPWVWVVRFKRVEGKDE